MIDKADQIPAAEYLTASILTNSHWEVVKFWGYTSPFLEHEPGLASLNIMRMLKDELNIELHLAISETLKSKSKIKKTVIFLTITIIIKCLIWKLYLSLAMRRRKKITS